MASGRPLHQLAAATHCEAARPLSARSDGSLRGRTARREGCTASAASRKPNTFSVTSMQFSLRCSLTRLASRNTAAPTTMTTARALATTAKTPIDAACAETVGFPARPVQRRPARAFRRLTPPEGSVTVPRDAAPCTACCQARIFAFSRSNSSAVITPRSRRSASCVSWSAEVGDAACCT
jgi:hypothetical protein